MSEVRKWLEGIGLGQYAEAFEANEIDMDLLRQVDDQMLKDIGISIGGHRLRIRNAIAKLAAAAVAPESQNRNWSTPERPLPLGAERRQLTVMFCDLVGSTALSSQARPRGHAEGHRRVSACCAELVRAERRLRCQVHGRRCARLLRLPASPRG